MGTAKYQAILTGFESMEQARRFLDWFEGAGEQDYGIEIYTGVRVQTDVHTGIIEHPSGVEYKIQIFHPVDDYDDEDLGSIEEYNTEEDDTEEEYEPEDPPWGPCQ